MTAQCLVENLSLTGDFVLTLDFEQAELKNWLLQFATQKPEEALRLIAEAQAAAIIAIARTAQGSGD